MVELNLARVLFKDQDTVASLSFDHGDTKGKIGLGAMLGLLLVFGGCGVWQAAAGELGTVTFPTSGSGKAQEAFLRGVAAMHSFWYEEAATAFREAQALDPDFAMAYWGEAMTYNHPVWQEQDLEAGRAVLERLAPTRKARLAKAPTPREAAYLEAVELLFGEGDKLARDRAYARAMKRLARTYPDDAEASILYALALLGTLRPGADDVRTRIQAAAILEEQFNAYPSHPGAPHYLIHAYDDPVHAPLGLRPARVYADIAPEAPHALHMPTHIFLQLGMWDDVVTSNERAWEASRTWVEEKHLPITHLSFHTLAWLQYGYLQQGRYDRARKLLEQMRTYAGRSDAPLVQGYFHVMEARYALETGQRTPVAMPTGLLDAESLSPYGLQEAASAFLALGLGAAGAGDMETAKQALTRLFDWILRAQAKGYDSAVQALDIMRREVEAQIHLARGEADTAVDLLEGAVTIAERMDPPSGPPMPIKPAHELLGQVLLDLDRPEAAARQFDRALQRTPRRTQALLGAARAAARLGEETRAREFYESLVRIWAKADPGLPEASEASRYLDRHKEASRR